MLPLVVPGHAGFTCRWQLTPDQPDVLLSVDYRGLLPDESIILELAPNNVIRLNAPTDGSPGAVFQASVWVEDSILVSFRTTRLSTDKGGPTHTPLLAHACMPASACARLLGHGQQHSVLVGAGLHARPERGLLCHTHLTLGLGHTVRLIDQVLPANKLTSPLFVVVVVAAAAAAVGAFSISWTSVASSHNGGMLDGKTMVVVLSCVSAAGAILAACCFYFVCCGRRRRAGVSQCNGCG